jgi:hypothetical protein
VQSRIAGGPDDRGNLSEYLDAPFYKVRGGPWALGESKGVIPALGSKSAYAILTGPEVSEVFTQHCRKSKVEASVIVYKHHQSYH